MSAQTEDCLCSAMSSPKRTALPSLTGSRIIAASVVFLFHASLGKMLSPYADPTISQAFSLLVSKGGWVGVSYFFVLSGFIMVWSLRAQDTALAYYRRRVAKVFPTHVITWLFAMLIGTVSPSRPDIWLPNLLLVHSWIPNIEVFVSVNQPSWSLCTEMFFYLLFPLLYPVLARLSGTSLWATLVGCVISLLFTQIAVANVVPSAPQLPEWPLSETQWWLSYNFPPFRMFEFVAGMVAARLVVEGRWRGPSVIPSFLLLLIGYAVALAVPFQFGLNLATLVPILFLIPAIASTDLKGQCTLLGSRPMVWLGEVSFGFYMIHFLVLLCVKTIVGEQRFDFLAGTAMILLAFGLSLLGGWLLYRYVESPMVRVIAKRRSEAAIQLQEARH